MRPGTFSPSGGFLLFPIDLVKSFHPDIIRRMRSRMSQVAVALALVTCLVCPVLETFDDWDHTLQTGDDTESALVILALCVGVTYSLARLIITISRTLSRTSVGSASDCIKGSLLSLIRPIALASAPGSPPPLNLRI